MSCVQIWVVCLRNRQLIISLLILLFSTFTHESFTDEERLASKLVEVAQMRTYEGMEEKVVMRNQIGSRPPRCQFRCSSCGHCEAVQVPVSPLLHGHTTTHFNAIPTVEYSRGDYVSDYKPMTWRCKCGSTILNP